MLLRSVNWNSCHILLAAKGRFYFGSDVNWNSRQESLLVQGHPLLIDLLNGGAEWTFQRESLDLRL